MFPEIKENARFIGLAVASSRTIRKSHTPRLYACAFCTYRQKCTENMMWK